MLSFPLHKLAEVSQLLHPLK